MAASEDAYGKGVFSGFVATIRRALRGLNILPDLSTEGEGSEAPKGDRGAMLFTNDREPRYLVGEVTDEFDDSYEPLAGVFTNWPCYLLKADLRLRQPEGFRSSTWWSMYRCGESHMLLDVTTRFEEAASALGVILAACQEDASGVSRQTTSTAPSTDAVSSIAMPVSTCNGVRDPSPRCSLTVDLYVCRGVVVPTTIREGLRLVAPLKPLARSITICPESSYGGRRIRSAAPPGLDRNKRLKDPGGTIVEFKM
jgi:hypothetical protein